MGKFGAMAFWYYMFNVGIRDVLNKTLAICALRVGFIAKAGLDVGMAPPLVMTTCVGWCLHVLPCPFWTILSKHAGLT